MIFDDKPSLEELYTNMLENENDVKHYGMPRRSGRYPWGSGDDPYQHSGDFLSRVDELRKQKFTFTDKDGNSYTGDTAIAKSMGLTTTALRTQIGLAKAEQRTLAVNRAKSLTADGLSPTEIGRIMGKNESTIRSYLNENSEVRMGKAKATADVLKKLVDEKGMIDVGTGVERELNVSKEKLNQALEILKVEGYPTYGGRVPQVTDKNRQTTLKVLCPPGTQHKEIFNYGDIHTVKDYITRDGGDTYEPRFQYPKSMDSKRLVIRYREDGGIDKDGVIELRRNVPDLDLKGSHYAQVRILVDDNKYLKGMAVYGDDKDFPPGVDVIFNTNKSKSVPKMDVLKSIKNDPENPFGSLIKDADQGGQYTYTDKNGKKQLGLINKRADEGDWAKWADNLPAQFLSKQSTKLAKQQLEIAIKDKMDEYNDIMSLTNPTIKKKLLQDFSDGCDSAAVHLKAAALPRQKHQVIIPIPSMKDNEIFAPRFRDGEEVVLIRYPHGGTFEIPRLRVNNKQAEAKKVLGTDVLDAVGINSKVAERLSGADFDGDSVMVIPTNNGKTKIITSDPLKGLEGFDPKMDYATYEKNNPKYNPKDKNSNEPEKLYYNSQGVQVKVMSEHQKQIEMGKVSNLITDMTLRGATNDELARAVKHSMVVIDAEKHKLDYKSSEIDNNIDALKKKYQERGASTLISRAKNEYDVDKRQGSPKVNLKGKDYYDPNRPEGALIWTTSDDLYYPVIKTDKKKNERTITKTDGTKITYSLDDRDAVDKYSPVRRTRDDGSVYYTNKAGDIEYRVKKRQQASTQMEETDDARTLISKADTTMEHIYADYANAMKDLANRSRKEMMTAGKIEYDAKAKTAYKKEVDSLNEKLMISEKNKPRERQAQTIANSRISAMKQDNPDMTKDELKKLSQRELSRARDMVGAKRTPIEITNREWDAIQAGAISETTLKRILNYADIDVLRERATPRNTKELSASKISRINSMRASGLTIQQIADALGVSTSTVSKHLN